MPANAVIDHYIIPIKQGKIRECVSFFSEILNWIPGIMRYASGVIAYVEIRSDIFQGPQIIVLVETELATLGPCPTLVLRTENPSDLVDKIGIWSVKNGMDMTSKELEEGNLVEFSDMSTPLLITGLSVEIDKTEYKWLR